MVIDLIRFVVDDTLTPIYPCSKWLLYCEMLEGCFSKNSDDNKIEQCLILGQPFHS